MAFVQKFTNIKTYKEILRSVKYEIPRLLGFKQCNIYLHDVNRKSLFALSIDEEAERLAMLEDPTGFEREFNFDERQIVHFPTNMGVSGFAFENDGVNYINGLNRLLEKTIYGDPISKVYSMARHRFTPMA